MCRPISIVRDEEPEDIEDFSVIISTVPPGVIFGNPETTIISIIDGMCNKTFLPTVSHCIYPFFHCRTATHHSTSVWRW